MKLVTTPEEDKFLTGAAKDYYQAAIAAHAFQRAAFKGLRAITDEFDAKLVRLGLPFENALEKASIAPPYPSIERKLVKQYLEAGICLQWHDDDPELEGKRLCVYWWIWLKHKDRRHTLGMRMKAATTKPFEWEDSDGGTSYVSLYFPLAQSAHIKECARKCTAEFVRVLSGCRKLLDDPASTEK